MAAEIFVFVGVAVHYIEQIVVAADEENGVGFDGEIDVWFVILPKRFRRKTNHFGQKLSG